MGITSIRRNEEERIRREARGASAAGQQPRPESIPYAQHLAALDELRTAHKARIIELTAAAKSAKPEQPDGRVEELTATLWQGHAMLSEAYAALEKATEAGETARVEATAAAAEKAALEKQLADAHAAIEQLTAPSESVKSDAPVSETTKAEQPKGDGALQGAKTEQPAADNKSGGGKTGKK